MRSVKWIEIYALVTLDCVIQMAYMRVGDLKKKTLPTPSSKPAKVLTKRKNLKKLIGS